MIIALDYDKTFTADKELWYDFINMADEKGHTVILCTARYEFEDNSDIYQDLGDEVRLYFTGKTPKRSFMRDLGISVDIWIDDKPESIVNRCSPQINIL